MAEFRCGLRRGRQAPSLKQADPMHALRGTVRVPSTSKRTMTFGFFMSLDVVCSQTCPRVAFVSRRARAPSLISMSVNSYACRNPNDARHATF